MTNHIAMLGDLSEFANTDQQRLVRLDEIVVLPKQVRSKIDVTTTKFIEFASSIREEGVNLPILLRLMDDGSLVLVAGERRYLASKMAGFETIPALIKTMTDKEFKVKQITENIHREDLSQLDLALAINEDYIESGNDLEAVASKYKKSKAWVSQLISAANPLDAATKAIEEDVTQDVDVVASLNVIEKKYGTEAALGVVDELQENKAAKKEVEENGGLDDDGEQVKIPTPREVVRTANQALKNKHSPKEKTFAERVVDFIYTKQKKGTLKLAQVWLNEASENYEDDVSAFETELRTLYDKGFECKSSADVVAFFLKTENYSVGQGLLRSIAYSIGLKQEEFSLEHVMQTAIEHVG